MKIVLPSGSAMNSPEFLFGSATSSYQIEGGADQRLASIWDTFCGIPGKIRDHSNGSVACDHVLRWQEDVDLMVELGLDAYRFSISWPRVMNPDGALREEGIDFYIRLLDRLNEHDIRPFVTLYHWDLPQYLEDQGGWLNRETAYRFQEYADQVTKEFGPRVYSYATLNEPFCSAYYGYETGMHAPGLADRAFGKKAAHHLLLAHGLAMPVLQRNSPDSLNGIVLNFTPCYAATDSAEDEQAARIADETFNQWYIQPLMDGKYPSIIDSLPEVERPDIIPGDLEIMAQPLDYLGVNYYTRAIYRADERRSFVCLPPASQSLTAMGWEIYPEAFTGLLVSLNRRYRLPPIYITENGAAMDDSIENGRINDTDRVKYIQEHLEAVNRAMEQGVDVRGYFAWSLMDNFEWAEGYEKRFGIVHVDYATQKRTIKLSGQSFRDMLSRRKHQAVH
ncbi:GH1 family beta-glucosidase [Pseudomonadota bacterium]